MRRFFANFKYGTRSLKTTLALYFIPISLIPTLSISYYAMKTFEESTRETLVRRARSERDAITSEIETLDADLIASARLHAKSPRLISAAKKADFGDIAEAVTSFRPNLDVRVYSLQGAFLGGRSSHEVLKHINYLSREGLSRVKTHGETVERFFSPDSTGFVTLLRVLIADKNRSYGVLEEEYHFGANDFAELKNRRQVDVVLLNRDLTPYGASFALSNDALHTFSQKAFQSAVQGTKLPTFVNIGDGRYASFLYDFSAGKQKNWGYIGVFLSMSSSDLQVTRLKIAIVYLTILLALTATLAIFIVSNRLVKPIVQMVSAMKRVQTGRVEQIPSIDSAYEVEYLVRSFNDMTQNIHATKRALETKLEELRRANQNLKTTQATLIQSAKMISLGQIVAGVAHELNNPIGFIYSNMHHLSDYLVKIRELVKAYRESREKLSPEDRAHLEKTEKDLEIDYILKDMEDLTLSCVEGAKRTKEIVLGLRTFSRMDESSFRDVDIHEGLRSTLKLLVTDMKGRVTVHEEFGALPLVECNLSQMNQVFMNLLSNAAHAIEGQGHIWIRTRSENEKAVIEIQDSGSGMAPEVLGQIFDPFFTTKRVGQGTGLGLSIAYGLVQKHHGSIDVQSVLGKGTSFTIRIPLRQPAAEVA